MFLQYGSVFLRIIDLTRFDRTTVWTEDGADLLYIDTIIGVTATYAPGGSPRLTSVLAPSPNTLAMLEEGDDRTAAALATTPRGFAPGARAAITLPPSLEDSTGALGVVPLASQHTGPETDAELRGLLWLPRQQLTLWAYARQTGLPIQWLCSPRPGFGVDLANGPKPLSVDIVSASGEPNSVVVHFQVQTRMSPCPVGSDRLVLSHRWQMSHEYDENNYLTRKIEGQIVFNGAVARLNGVTPDFVRAQFIHPIPIGYERKVPQITQSSDGLTIRYTITDTDPTITFDPGNSGAVKIQILEKLVQTTDRALFLGET